MEREWQVLRNGVLWTDRFDSEVGAIIHMEECRLDDNADYEVVQMSKEEQSVYRLSSLKEVK